MEPDRTRPHPGPLFVLGATLGLYLVVLLPRLLWIDRDGMWAGQIHLWSDWPWHLSMARHVADAPLDALQNHPLIGGQPLRYPFALAFLCGGLLRLGVPLTAAFLLPVLLLWLLLLMGMLRFWTALLGRPWLALVPIYLFFLSAGPGAVAWIVDIWQHGTDALWAPPREYGAVPGYEWYAGNFLVGMLLPQRAFLPGMTLTLWLLVALLRPLAPRALVLWGLAAGCLPVVHVHSLLALLALGSVVRAWKRSELLALLPGVLVAVVFWALFLRPTTPYPGFVSWHPGYQAAGGLEWLVMWGRFWGLALPATVAGMCFLRAGLLRRVVLASGALFVLGNLILFQPIAWDNSKVFLWAYFGFCGALTLLLERLWSRRAVGKAIAVVIAVALTLTGVAELIRLQRTDRFRAQIVSATDLQLAEAIRLQTPPGAIFLTGMDVTNAPLVAGRSIFLGFGGWMPNFGFVHKDREAALRTLFAGGTAAEALLREYPIDYVLIGPGERSSYAANEAWFAAHYPLVLQAGSTQVYQIRR